MNPRLQILLTKRALIVWGAILILLMLSPFIIGGFAAQKAEADNSRINCELAGERAQQLLESNPAKFKSLDRDKDGKACENNYK